MSIELSPLNRVRPDEKNPRKKHAAVDALARSIRELGSRQRIVVDAEGVLVVGHTRWKAATSLGLAEVPVHVASEPTPEQARAHPMEFDPPYCDVVVQRSETRTGRREKPAIGSNA